MQRLCRLISVCWVLALLGMAPTCQVVAAGHTRVVPLDRAHSHNDYEHARPLLDAIEAGFCNVEADIFLVDGRLLVGHERDRLHPDRTLESLYLDPLLARTRRGKVNPPGAPIRLMIDIKTDAGPTYAVLARVLERYRPMLTRFDGRRVQRRAVTVVLSGNRPVAELFAATERFAAIDGRPDDLDTNPPVALVPWVSSSWGSLFKWNGVGSFPEDERARLIAYVHRAHSQGRLVRFWGAPDRAEFWQVLDEAGVDLINTDRLLDLQRYFLSKKRAR